MPEQQKVLPSDLEHALQLLNLWCQENSLKFELHIIGAMALHLSGIASNATNDIDSVSRLSDSLRIEIERIGRQLGLHGNWLNDQASDIPLPEGFHSRMLETLNLGNIKLFVPSRRDMIALKAAAFVIRGAEDPKDYSDLRAMAVTGDELDWAVTFIRKTQSPPEKKFFPDFEEVLRSLYDLV